MATDQTVVRSQFAHLTGCERDLRSTNYISTRHDELGDARFDVTNPVPLTLSHADFVDTVRTVAARHGLAVHETDDPYHLVVALQ
ncbi:hypothetical protein [Halomarina oriensis]|uniref:Uncharacterized protein n=1 Tax=Halomarina oriensis TaxID=671145 RepID=A0A6B0GVS5_9EURY|nr:hypothetical protein [Halomarina oriensis]MWG35808.1 hypothetical protein [Halomarina oriensis]